MEEQLREKSDELISKAKALRERLLAETDWRSLGESDGVQGFQREEGNTVYVKGVGVINFPPNVISDFIWNNNNRSKYEDDIGSIITLHDFGNRRIDLVHKILPFVVNDREILALVTRENDGENVLLFLTSIDLDVPVAEKRVRATAHIYSYYLANIEDIATEVTVIVGVDPNGSIPQFLVSQIAGQAAFQISRIRNVLSS